MAMRRFAKSRPAERLRRIVTYYLRWIDDCDEIPIQSAKLWVYHIREAHGLVSLDRRDAEDHLSKWSTSIIGDAPFL